MKEEDRMLLLMGWSLLMIGIILLICKITYRMDQVDQKLNSISDSLTSSITDATVTDATPTEATTTEAALPEEPSDDEIVMSVRPELLDSSEDTLEVSSEEVIITTEEIITPTPTDAPVISDAPTFSGGLTRSSGVYDGPSGKETYYNLDMSGVISIMRSCGYDETEYPYWIRDDGVKMLGPYVMVAANLNIRPRGTILSTSLGDAIVCDTGAFAYSNSYQLDIAVSW